MKHLKFRRENYPRPQFVRQQWTNLNGEWDFTFDKSGEGRKKGYMSGFTGKMKINVPFAYQVKASGIGDPTLCEDIWYCKKITLAPASGEKILLHLEGCDYETQVYLNGADCGKDTGGYHRLTFDLTSAAKKGENTLVIAVHDDYSTEKPRGKQRWKDKDFGCWYIDTSGIYKTAWLETVNENHIKSVKFTADINTKSVKAEFETEGSPDAEINICVTYGGRKIAEKSCVCKSGRGTSELFLGSEELHLWNVGAPELYETELKLTHGGKVCDKVESYFGVRKLDYSDGKILLNGKPLYQKLILDQGYWRDSGLTAPDERALEQDIVQMVSMGFNGCRKHQKVEDERFLYYADVYGYIVWAEMPSMYNCTEAARDTFKREWLLSVQQQYNHPCVLCWVPFNESWGIEQIRTDKNIQTFVNEVYYATKAYDGTRPVITNDGWEHTISDILTIHHYTQDGSVLRESFDTPEKCTADKFNAHERGAFAEGWNYRNQPIMITEFGGTAFVKDTSETNWGYGEGVKNGEEFLARFKSLIDAIDSLDYMCGYCYTQLSDVYHEVNGLTDFDRNEKEPAEIIKSILTANGR